jgi:zinc protease
MRVFGLLLTAAAILLGQTPPPAARKPPSPAAIPSYKDLRYPELRPIASPRVDRVTLPNGLQLLLLEDHELPLVNGTLMVRTGSAFDPPEKTGLAVLTAQTMLGGGTTGRPGDDLLARFQNLGADIDGTVSENFFSISFSTLKENTNDVLDALKDSLTAPDFPQERLDLAKAGMRNTIAHRNDDPAAILQREFVRALVGKNSPYGAQVEYTTVDRISRADLVNFYRRYFFPKNVMLSLEGDFDSAGMKTRVESLFADWKADQPAVPEFPNMTNDGAAGRYLAVKKDAPLAYIAVGQLSGDYLDKDYPALQIMADILSGGQRGRFHRQLHGPLDALSVSWTPGFGHAGLFQISGAINAFETTKVLQAINQELNTIRNTEVTEAELKSAKDAALNSFVFTLDNHLSILPRLTQYEYFNLPKDYIAQHQTALAAVTRADVLRVAKERVDPAKMTAVVVANPTAFEAPLESLGGSAPIPIDLTIPVATPAGDAPSQRHGKELLERAQQASGGADKLAAVADYVQEMVYETDAGAGGTQSTVTERWVAPGYLRQDNHFAAGTVSAFCDGKTGWVTSAQGSAPLSGVQLRQMQSDLFRVFFSLLLSDRVAGRNLSSLDENSVEIGDGTGNLVKLVVDAATGLVQNVLYDAPTANGPLPVIDTYSDYRDIGGLKIPFKVVITVAGKKYQDVIVKNFQPNAGLKVQDLEKRP